MVSPSLEITGLDGARIVTFLFATCIVLSRYCTCQMRGFFMRSLSVIIPTIRTAGMYMLQVAILCLLVPIHNILSKKIL